MRVRRPQTRGTGVGEQGYDNPQPVAPQSMQQTQQAGDGDLKGKLMQVLGTNAGQMQQKAGQWLRTSTAPLRRTADTFPQPVPGKKVDKVRNIFDREPAATSGFGGR